MAMAARRAIAEISPITESFVHSWGCSSLSPRLRLALSLRTMQAGILALDDASQDLLHQGLGTGVQVSPPSFVSKLLVFRAFQMVAWSASVARTPPRSSESGEWINFQMGAAVGGEQNGTRAADNPADLIGRSGASEQIGENAAGLARPGGTSILGEFDQASAASAPNHCSSPAERSSADW